MPRQWVSQVLAGVLLQARAVQSEAAMAGVPVEPAIALLRAWRPYRMAHKATWWEAMALPADVSPEKELEFRATVRGLASGSLDLLRAAISGGSFMPCEPANPFLRPAAVRRMSLTRVCAAALPRLYISHACPHWDGRSVFSLQVYAHIIGMFELNNLLTELLPPNDRAVVVPSPVEDYFLSMESLPPPEKAAARTALAPLLDLLGNDFGEPCEGMTTFCCLSVARTAFYVLQSCVNHSCEPNAHAFKRAEVRQLLTLSYGYGLEMPQAAQLGLWQDRDGRATLLALRHIAAGEEVTISYIDESAPWHERQAELADYGFACHCTRCEREAMIAA
eukprot:SM000183S03982  [mRNA]  locus=s183:115366:117396:+ [translate_table: standard]